MPLHKMPSYDEAMKYLCAMLAFPLSLLAAEVSGVKAVYLLPMANGLDQYLAGRLTNNKVVQVVTDPQKADAVMSDAVGQSFEEKFAELYGSKEKGNGKSNDNAEAGEVFARVGGKSRANGMLFLVDRKSHEVLWSVYELPKHSNPDELNRSANRIAEKLNRAITGNPK